MQDNKLEPAGPSTIGFTSGVAAPPGSYPPPAPAVNYLPPPPEYYVPPSGNYPPPSYSQQAYPLHTTGYPTVHPYDQAPYSTQINISTTEHNEQTPQPAPPPQYYGTASGPASLPPASQLHNGPPPRPSSWSYRMKINRPQVRVLLAATFIFLTGGMNIAWSIGFRNRVYLRLSEHTRIAWFIGAIIGAAIAGFLPKVIPKRAITVISSALVLIGGIVNVSSHYNVDALTAGLYLNGIANGLLFAPTLALAGEQAAFYMRGKFTTSTEQLSFNIGIVVQILLCDTWRPSHNHYDSINLETMHWIFNCLFGFTGLCCAAFLFIESPVDLLVAGREMAANDAVRRLQCDPTPYNDFYQMQEHRSYIAQNDELTREQSFVQACPILIKLSILRALNAISISCFMFDILHYCNGSYIVFGICRCIGSIFSSTFVDSLGRKGLTLAGLLIASIFAYTIGGFMFYPYNNIFMLLCFFQLFCGIAFAPSSAYISEAYPLKNKQSFISFTFMIELVVFIIFSILEPIQEFWYVIGGIYTATFALGIWCLPETQRTTLREALQKFRPTAFRDPR